MKISTRGLQGWRGLLAAVVADAVKDAQGEDKATRFDALLWLSMSGTRFLEAAGLPVDPLKRWLAEQ